MKIIHKKGYDEQECARFKDIIFGNILQSIRVLINAMNKFEMDYGTQAGKNAAEEIGKLSEQQIILNAAQMFPELHPKIKAIWQDPATKKVLERRAELQLNDSADYYLVRYVFIYILERFGAYCQGQLYAKSTRRAPFPCQDGWYCRNGFPIGWQQIENG